MPWQILVNAKCHEPFTCSDRLQDLSSSSRESYPSVKTRRVLLQSLVMVCQFASFSMTLDFTFVSSKKLDMLVGISSWCNTCIYSHPRHSCKTYGRKDIFFDSPFCSCYRTSSARARLWNFQLDFLFSPRTT